MQLPRLAVLLAVYSGVHATLSPDDPTGKPDMKLESNQTGGSRFLGIGGGPSGFMGPNYGNGMSSGMGSYPPQSQQPGSYSQAQSQAQAQIQPQSQVYRVPAIQGSPYRPSGQFSPYSGMTGGVIEQMAPVSDEGFSSSPSKFAPFQGGSMNTGYSSGSLGGLSLPQTVTVVGNIPVTVSGTLNLGVRGQLTVMQDGGPSGGNNMYEGPSGSSSGPSSFGSPQGSGGSYQPYQGSSSGTVSGFPGSPQVPSSGSMMSFSPSPQPGMIYNRQPLQQEPGITSSMQVVQTQSQSQVQSSAMSVSADSTFGRQFNSLAPYQPGLLPPVSPYAPAIGGSYGPVGSPFSKIQSGESVQTQSQTQVGGAGMVQSLSGGSPYQSAIGGGGTQGQTLTQSVGNTGASLVPVNMQSSYSSGVQNAPVMPSYQGGYSPNMGSSPGMMGSVMPSGQSGFSMPKQMQMMPMSGGQMQQPSYQVQRQVGGGGGGSSSPYNVRYADVVARALNDEPSDKPE